MEQSKIIWLIKLLNPDTSHIHAETPELQFIATECHKQGFEEFRQRILSELEFSIKRVKLRYAVILINLVL